MKMKQIGARIRVLREKQGLTQQELADRLQVTRQTVSNYEIGRSQPDLEMLEQLANVLGVEVSVLLGEGPASPREARALAWLRSWWDLSRLEKTMLIVALLVSVTGFKTWSAGNDVSIRLYGVVAVWNLFPFLMIPAFFSVILALRRGNFVERIGGGLLALSIPALPLLALHRAAEYASGRFGESMEKLLLGELAPVGILVVLVLLLTVLVWAVLCKK